MQWSTKICLKVADLLFKPSKSVTGCLMSEIKFQSKKSKYETNLQQPFNLAVALPNFCIKHIIAVFGTCDVKSWSFQLKTFSPTPLFSMQKVCLADYLCSCSFKISTIIFQNK